VLQLFNERLYKMNEGGGAQKGSLTVAQKGRARHPAEKNGTLWTDSCRSMPVNKIEVLYITIYIRYLKVSQ
jgi:hypothetical protein